MATYVPGVETYLPDIKPFTPDYKFLSAVLDVRTDKYNANWKATNDLYNKVVYADLSRKDTKEQRNQYINQIAPSLEKISGMDLSMVQNVESAKAVFAPFFEDDLIVSDIMHTTNYRKEMDYANRLIDSPNQKQREKYSQDGVKGLQYHMEDFINANPNKAMKMGLPKFVEDADLFELAQETLSAIKPPLKMKVDHYGINPDGSVNTDWIITEQNGNLVTGPALQYIRKALLDDPRVIRHYQNQAFVRGRDFAAEGMANGMFTTKEEGQAAWASETINRITQQNEYYIKKDIKALAQAEDINVRWDNYKETNGIVPGSDDEKAMLEQRSSYEATKAALDAKVNIKKTANAPIKDFEGTLNKAYNLLMQNNISKDMQAAAQAYGARDMEYTMRVNEYAKQQKQFQFEMSKLETQHQNAINLAYIQGDIKSKNDYELAKAKGEIVYDPNGVPVNPLLQTLLSVTPSVGTEVNTEFAMGEDEKPDPNTPMYLKSTQDYFKERSPIRNEQLDVVTRILSFLNPAGEKVAGKATQKYTVKVGGANFTGSIDQIKTKLGTQENGNYKYKDDITTLYNQQSAILNDPDQMGKKYPGKSKSDTYVNLYKEVYGDQGINNRLKNLDQRFNTVANNYKETSDKVIELVKSNNSNVKNLMEKAGMPPIFYTTPGGLSRMYTKPEYIAKVAELAAQGKVKNIDLIGWDKGTGNKDYKAFFTYNRTEMDEQRRIFNSKTPMFNSDGTPAIQAIRGDRPLDMKHGDVFLDMKAIEAEAGLVYDAINSKTNSALTGHESKNGEFKSGTLKSIMYGRTTPSDMLISPVYKATIDPLSPTAEGNATLNQMITQKNKLDANGENYSIVLGNLKDKKDAKSIANDALATRAYNAYIADMTTWLGNPKRSNTAAITPRANIEYSGILGAAGDGKKTTAGYTLNGFNEWLSSKVKGSATEASGAAGEYGLFTKGEVAQLQNGISMVFDQKQDINPRSSRNQYYSNTLAAIEASPEKYVEYSYPGIDGTTPTATYRIVKTGTDQFYATYRYSTYQPNGTYTTSDWQQIPIAVGSFNAGELIDAQIKALEEEFKGQRQMNSQDHDKNSAVKGIKN
jgi:hypothetical protein